MTQIRTGTQVSVPTFDDNGQHTGWLPTQGTVCAVRYRTDDRQVILLVIPAQSSSGRSDRWAVAEFDPLYGMREAALSESFASVLPAAQLFATIGGE
jgi:hypothetical protein